MKRLLLTSFDRGGKLAFGACRHVVSAGSEAKKRQKSRKMSFFLSKDLHMSKKSSTFALAMRLKSVVLDTKISLKSVVLGSDFLLKSVVSVCCTVRFQSISKSI